MYQIPKKLDLSEAIGQCTTQLRIGPFDIQFSFGKVNFNIQSRVVLKSDGKIIGQWEEGSWPDATFYEVFNRAMVNWQLQENSIILSLENGIEMQLIAGNDGYECIQISIEEQNILWVI
ncbi:MULTISPECIES: hypothetical protein [Pseudomonadaceae]|uniref:Uncharacterized protein n=1 Tax=Phytopseudomonas seleniipraecipitans TaxID=640205 RepID=A0A1G7HYL6_9GAMM|nr:MULTISPECIES: hypothetical protein [Pseudomonadaceae]MCQ4261109.1 hypothetical protein [Stutzerimonas stutzeri]UUD63578.1 hypothetical protein D16iCDA_18145 [Pseudomonas seleniipraecipitans]SDF05611.1 hypothetical protein SAMN05216381_0837 [Pseudomonas seleniipraecipitans]